ncbi:hypothetical protein JW962_00385 [Candidatus Dojkabacteria bacterium]|nr:hypothetical protein [Candidatus Dojkabacteria bacterium]
MIRPEMNYKALLLKQKRKIFKTDDFTIIWKISNKNTLLTTIKRYVKDKTLHRIRKGLYSVVPLAELDPFLVGTSYVKGFCYVSLQTVLELHGLINQFSQKITLIGNRSINFSVNNTQFLCKKLSPKYLNNSEGINLEGEYPIATRERAIADILYFNPKFHFDKDISKYEKELNLIKSNVYSWK